jgi:large subunit ribosomal protein L9
MEVILLERVEKLGQMGQVVDVKPGYARNFLLPQKKALRATKANLAFFETQRSQLEATNLKRRQEAEQASSKIDGLSVIIIRQAAETGMLYGSVTARDIADAVTAAGFTVNRQQIAIDHPIKGLGIHSVRVVLHPEVSVAVKVNVARSQEEAEIQAQRGAMVTAAELRAEEDAQAAAAAQAEDEDEESEEG